MKSEYVYELKDVQYNYTVKDLQKDTLETFQLQINDMKIRRGVLTAILGRSGSGKTTLLMLLGLLRKPLQGSINMNIYDSNAPNSYSSDEIWKNQSLAERIRALYLGFALQNGELLPFLTLKDNIELPLKLIGEKRDLIQKEVKKWLTVLFTEEELYKKIETQMPHKLARGQYQRGAVARSFAHRPEIILADEPAGNLDIIGAHKMLEYFREYIKTHQSVILVTHDLNLALEYAEEIWVLKKGGICKHYDKRNDTSDWPDEDKIARDMGD